MLSAFPKEQELFSVEQVMVILGGVSRTTVWRMLEDGTLQVRKIRRRAMITRGSLLNVIGGAQPAAYLARAPMLNNRTASSN